MQNSDCHALPLLAALAILAPAWFAAGAQAETTVAQATRRPASDQALARAQRMIRQLSTEKAELEVTRSELEGKVEALSGTLQRNEEKLKEFEQGIVVLDKANQAFKTKLQGSYDEIKKIKQDLEQTIEKLKQTTASLQQSEQATARAEGTIVEREQRIKELERKNLLLYQANAELLDKYQHKGVWDAILQREPLTQIKQVEIENVLQEYRFKLEDLKDHGEDAQ